jgi:hypothetical protein
LKAALADSDSSADCGGDASNFYRDSESESPQWQVDSDAAVSGTRYLTEVAVHTQGRAARAHASASGHNEPESDEPP